MRDRARDPAAPAARPGVPFLRALYPGPDPPARPWPQLPGVAHARSPGAPVPQQPLPRAAATPPAHVTLAPLFPSVRSLGPRLSRGVGGRAALSVSLVCLSRQPGVSSREAGAGLPSWAASLAGFGSAGGMGPASFVVRATSWKAHINCKSPLKTFGGGLSLAFFLGPRSPAGRDAEVGPVTRAAF